MRIGKYFKLTDINTYRRLMNLSRRKRDKHKVIKLGDKVERLMQHDSYIKAEGALRQVKWGG